MTPPGFRYSPERYRKVLCPATLLELSALTAPGEPTCAQANDLSQRNDRHKLSYNLRRRKRALFESHCISEGKKNAASPSWEGGVIGRGDIGYRGANASWIEQSLDKENLHFQEKKTAFDVTCKITVPNSSR